MTTIEKIKKLIDKLSFDEQSELLEDLSSRVKVSTFVPSEIKCCPHCKSKGFIKHGYSKQGQRFKCKSCQRTFSPTTGTAIHCIKKKGKFMEYSKVIKEEGLHTIDHMKKRIGISNQSAFDWRHRLLLSSPKKKKNLSKRSKWTIYGFCTAKKVERV